VEKEIQVVKNYGSEIPIIKGRADEIQQVFVNIIQNAIQAMGKRGVLTISSFVKNGNLLIEFSDTGVGIPTENMERIFDPFFSTMRDHQKTGLGLSISKRIVEDHGGKIHVDSKPGKGSKFTISLPLK
ncbi:MAG: sensor histidine kinase, partial [Fidelibacterota bacterium]